MSIKQRPSRAQHHEKMKALLSMIEYQKGLVKSTEAQRETMRDHVRQKTIEITRQREQLARLERRLREMQKQAQQK